MVIMIQRTPSSSFKTGMFYLSYSTPDEYDQTQPGGEWEELTQGGLGLKVMALLAKARTENLSVNTVYLG